MNISWNEGDAQLTAALAITTICFLLYWFIAHADGFRTWLSKRKGKDFAGMYGALYQKGMGIVFIGIVPATFALWLFPGSLTAYGLGFADERLTLIWILCLGGALSLLPYYSARKEDMQAFYPQVRANQWTPGLMVLNSLVWVVYMGAYEFLFRSFLFTNCIEAVGVVPAMAITAVLSSVTHMPKGAKETFATIPFSVVLCLAFLHTGAIWAGYAVHVMLALANDYWALYFQPNMNLIRKPSGKVYRL